MNYVRYRVKGRKQHICVICTRKIRRGEKHVRGGAFGEGTAWTWRECLHCDAVLEYVRTLWDDDEYNSDTIGEWEPQTIDQWRVKAMWHMKWQRLDGGLHPIPIPVGETVERETYSFVRITDIRPGVPVG